MGWLPYCVTKGKQDGDGITAKLSYVFLSGRFRS